MLSARSVKDRSPRWLLDAANATTRSYGLGTTPWRQPPDFLVIGTKRGGTTSLFSYLMMHPGVLGLFPQTRGKKSTDYFFKEHARGERWYRSHFHATGYRTWLERRLGYPPVAGEASPYYVWDPRIAGHVRHEVPRVKAIMLVRDPVERAFSHFLERKENGVEPLGFEEALRAEPERTAGELDRMLADPGYQSDLHDWYSYRARGVYLPQIRNWLAQFPAEQLLVLRSEDMYADVQDVFDSVCDFLRVSRWSLPSTRAFNASGVRTAMPEGAREELRDFYAPHNRELESYLGRSLGWS
jgi:Sulfotransferase domain